MSQPIANHSLQHRLVWRTLAGFALVWVLVMAWVAVDARHELDELLDAHLTQTAALLLVQQSSDLDEDTVYASSQAHKYSSNVAYQVFRGGELLAASANAGAQAMAQHTQGFATITRADGQAWRVYVTRSANSEVRVYVAEAMSSRTDIVWALLRGMALPFVLALPLWAVVVWLNTRSSLLPIKALRQRLLDRSHAALSPVHVPDLPIEVQPLQDALNALLRELAARMDSERRFTADAAHELRTPIAAIRTQAQVALMAESPTQLVLRQQALQDTIRACDRAGRVVEQLLTLSRLEEQAQPAQPLMDVHLILQQVAAELAPTALQRHQELEILNEVKDPQCLMQVCSDTALQILFRNLLDNALRYTPDEGKVRVTLRCADASTLELVFEDSGPGMSEQDMARLGERFFRVLGTGQSGSGLGWSIVQRIAQVHGMTWHVQRSAALGGLQVRLQMNSKA